MEDEEAGEDGQVGEKGQVCEDGQVTNEEVGVMLRMFAYVTKLV